MQKMTHLITEAVDFLERHPGLPDIRYFMQNVRFQLHWDAERELHNDIGAFICRMQTFGSLEVKLILWLENGKRRPEANRKQLYTSYPTLMWVFMLLRPQLVYYFRTLSSLFRLSATMENPMHRLVAAGWCDSLEAFDFAAYRDWGEIEPIMSADKWKQTGKDFRMIMLEVAPPASAMFIANVEDEDQPMCFHTWAPESLACYCQSLADPISLSMSPVANHILWRYTPREIRAFSTKLEELAGEKKFQIDAAILMRKKPAVTYIQPLYVPKNFYDEFPALFRYKVCAKVLLQPRSDDIVFSQLNTYQPELFIEDFGLLSELGSAHFAALNQEQMKKMLLHLSVGELEILFSENGRDEVLLLQNYNLFSRVEMFPSSRFLPKSVCAALSLYNYLCSVLECSEEAHTFVLEKKMLVCCKHILDHDMRVLPLLFKLMLATPYTLCGSQNPLLSTEFTLDEASEIVDAYIEGRQLEAVNWCSEHMPVEAFSPFTLESNLYDIELEPIYATLNRRKDQ